MRPSERRHVFLSSLLHANPCQQAMFSLCTHTDYVFRSLKGAVYHFSNFEGSFTFSNSLYLKT